MSLGQEKYLIILSTSNIMVVAVVSSNFIVEATQKFDQSVYFPSKALWIFCGTQVCCGLQTPSDFNNKFVPPCALGRLFEMKKWEDTKALSWWNYLYMKEYIKNRRKHTLVYCPPPPWPEHLASLELTTGCVGS